MRPAVILGLLLIVIGVLALVYQGISYTEKETVVDLGPIEATTEETKTIPLPPILGGVALAAGTVLVIVGNRKA
jgi:hypothetical protein